MENYIKKKKPGGLYIRYLLSYTIILLIPLLVLTFFYSSRFMKKFYEEIYETVDLELVQISTQLEHQLESMQSIVGQLTLSGTVQKTASAQNPLDLNPVITYLSGLCSANSFIEDMVLVPDENNYVTTSTTTCERNYYFRHMFQLSEAEANMFQQKLLNSPAFLCMPKQKILNLNVSSPEKDVVLFAYPLFTDYQKREGSALFYVKSQTINKLLSQKLESYQAQVFMVDANGTIISLLGTNQAISPEIQSFLSTPEKSTSHFGNKNYILRSYQSEENPWSYYAFIPNSQTTFSQVNDIMREFLLTIIIILLLAGITILFLQKVNYAPMKRLRDKATEISPDNASSNELAAISHALDYLSLQNSSLSSKLAGSFTAVKNERLYRLLSGGYGSEEDFNLDCSELDLTLEHEYFAANILMLHTKVENVDMLAQEIKKQFQVPYIYYYLHNFHPDQIVLLFNLPEQGMAPGKLLVHTQSYLRSKYNLLTTIGSGTIVNGTERIPQSYMEAVSALDYRFVKGNGTIIEFNEALGPKHTTVVYPYQEFETLKNSIQTRNENHIRGAIQTIIHFMEESQLPLYLARSICFDLIHLVNELCRNQKNLVASSPLQLSGVETAQEIIETLRIWSDNLSGLTGSPSKKVDLKEVIRFVDGNCLHCDFSAYETAEYFEMTLPAFSKFFKDQTGQNVMDYTIQLRMQKAKELLRTTELPLKEIGEMVGYYNISSFTRRFKLNQGITPSDYRKISLTEGNRAPSSKQ